MEMYKFLKKYHMKKALIVILILIVSLPIMAQREAMYSHYMYNMTAFNPAFAGSRDAISVLLLHRSQWVGFDGAPTTQTFTIHSPIKENMGLGLSVVNDKIGYENNTMINIDYSYTIRVSPKAKLAFGIKAGANMYNINFSEIAASHPEDPVFNSNDESTILPNFGFGTYLFNDKSYIGFSIPKLLELDFQNNTTSSSASFTDKRKHYYVSAGTIIDASEQLKIRPATIIKLAYGALIEMDISSLFIWNEKFILGGMYRTGADFGLLAGLKITKELEFGYSYDWSTTNETTVYNDGSHEIILRYDIANKNSKKKNNRSLVAKYF